MTSRQRLNATTELKEARDQHHQSLSYTSNTSIQHIPCLNVQIISLFVFASQCAIFGVKTRF